MRDARLRGRRISAAIAVGGRLAVRGRDERPSPAAAAPRAGRSPSGSSFQRSFPGRVVPPPRPARRESEPAARSIGAGDGRSHRAHASAVGVLARRTRCSTILVNGPEAEPGGRGHRPSALAEFQAGIRRRYTDDQILAELRASATRLGRSPTMKEFAADPGAGMHPQTVIEHFGSWNAAKRAAGLMPRRFATREELVERLRRLGEELGRTPTAQDIRAHRGTMPSASLYWHTFGSLTTALREAGFDVAVGEERLERALDQGTALARSIGRLPKFGGLAGGAARRSGAPHRVAGLPAVRGAPWCVGDVPVPRPRTPARGRSRGPGATERWARRTRAAERRSSARAAVPPRSARAVS